MFRALGMLRFVVLRTRSRSTSALRRLRPPRVGALVIAFLALWTVFAVWAYAARLGVRPRCWWRTSPVAVAAIALSPYVKGEGLNATLPGFWVMGVVLAWAILWRWVGGLAAAVAVSIADIAIRDDFTQKVYGNIFLLVLGGAIVGFLSGLLQQMAAQRDRAERAAAAAAERQRLARVVHDGVLQVLALVQRRAPELGPDGVELGRLAGEQEVRLRGLVQQDSRETVAARRRPGPRAAAHRPADPAGARRRPRHARDPAGRARGRGVAAVESCLSNVRHHVGRTPRPGCCSRSSTTAGWSPSATTDRASRKAGSRSPPPRAGWACSSRSSAGCATSAAPRRCAGRGQGTEWELAVPRQRGGPA